MAGVGVLVHTLGHGSSAECRALFAIFAAASSLANGVLRCLPGESGMAS